MKSGDKNKPAFRHCKLLKILSYPRSRSTTFKRFQESRMKLSACTLDKNRCYLLEWESRQNVGLKEVCCKRECVDGVRRTPRLKHKRIREKLERRAESGVWYCLGVSVLSSSRRPSLLCPVVCSFSFLKRVPSLR
jgi:hypothetical protein